MLSIFSYFSLMFISFLILFLMSFSLFYLDFGLVFEWLLMSVNSLNIEILILIDWVSLLFISFIFLISSMILIYSYMYMHADKFISRFIYLVILFIFSMILMIISPNVVSILFGWDGLGLVSYCLVIYYQNYMSFNSGMVTVLCNRIGDVGLLMAIGLSMISGSWNIYMLQSGELLVLMLGLAAITKSAQIPFSSWLPMAMAAPTPVSALVHSSTLVTAGVYLMIRFNSGLMESGVNIFLFFLAVLTMFMSGLMANVEFDLKKIIALSTLSQLGLMMMILSVGFKMMAFYHLLTHAIFKSMLFMCAGIIIHSMKNNQDIRAFGNLNEFIPFTMMSFMVSSLSLCGFPFLAGFYSKDLIMELIYDIKLNMFMHWLIVVSLMFTVSYSLRLFYYVFFSNLKFYSFIDFSESSLMNFSMIVLVLSSMSVGSMLNWVFFFDFYMVYLDMNLKLLTLEVCVLGVCVGWLMSVYNWMKNFYYLNFYLSSMWFLNYFYYSFYKPMNFISVEFYNFDKTWVEFSMKNIMFYLIKNMSSFSYKMYMFMFIFMYIMILVYLVY